MSAAPKAKDGGDSPSLRLAGDGETEIGVVPAETTDSLSSLYEEMARVSEEVGGKPTSATEPLSERLQESKMEALRKTASDAQFALQLAGQELARLRSEKADQLKAVSKIIEQNRILEDNRTEIAKHFVGLGFFFRKWFARLFLGWKTMADIKNRLGIQRNHKSKLRA